jgi:hypothetical protein
MQQLIITMMAVFGMMAPVAIGRLRRILITPRLLALCKRMLPLMSSTERDALDAVTTWWDAALFTGKPRWSKLRDCGGQRQSGTQGDQPGGAASVAGALVMLPALAWQALLLRLQYASMRASSYRSAQHGLAS